MSEQVDTNTEVVETAVVETPAHFTAFGVENQEGFDEKVNYYKGIETNWNELSGRKTEIDNTYEVLKTIEKEPNPEITMLESFLEKGISRRTANELLDSTPEELADNPLKTLLLAEAVKNTEFYNKNKDEIEKSLREEFGLDEEGEYTPTSKMKIAALRAVEDINKFKADVGLKQNPYTFAKTRLSEESQKFESQKKFAATELETVVASLTEVTDKQGENVFTFKVSKEDIALILNDKDTISAIFTNADTKEGKEAIKTFVEQRIRIQKYLNGEAYKEWESSRAADVERAATQKVFAGTPIVVDRSGSSKASGKDSPILIAAREAGLAK